MSYRSLSVLVFGLIASGCTERFVVPQRPWEQPPAVVVTVDVTAAPDLREWAHDAAEMIVDWHPRVWALLASPGFEPAREIELVFLADFDYPAGASGRKILVSDDAVRARPEDVGMIIHELCHVLQAYRAREPSWLVEGIADYVRFFHFEPDAPRAAVDPKTASYTDGYVVAAAFLAWIERERSPGTVGALNRAMREDRYDERLFADRTGRELGDLWAAFVATL